MSSRRLQLIRRQLYRRDVKPLEELLSREMSSVVGEIPAGEVSFAVEDLPFETKIAANRTRH